MCPVIVFYHQLSSSTELADIEQVGLLLGVKQNAKATAESRAILHTWNPAGAKNMTGVLKNSIYAPFGTPLFTKCIEEINKEI